MIVLKDTQDRVLEVLQAVSGIIERRHTLPILANVLIRSSTTISNGMPESGGGGASVDLAEVDAGGDTATVVSGDEDEGGGESDGEPARRRPRQLYSTFAPALLAFTQLSQYIGFGRSRIYALISQGEFPPPVKIGKSSRWVRAEVDDWLSAHIAARGLNLRTG